MVFSDASVCLTVLFVNRLQKKKKKSFGGISKISFVKTPGSCNWLSRTIRSERMTFRPLPQKRALCRERRRNLGLRLLTETSRALFPVSHANGGSGARLRHATALPESLRKSTPQNGERTSSQAPCEHVDPHSSCGRLSPRRQGRRGWDWQASRSRPGWGLVCHR